MVIGGQKRVKLLDQAKIYPSDLSERQRYEINSDISDSENFHHTDLTDFEMANLVYRLVDRCGSEYKASQTLGCSVWEIKKWLSFREVKQYVKDAEAKDLYVVDFIKNNFDKLLWAERFSNVKGLHRRDAIKALKEMASGGKPNDVLQNIESNKNKKRKNGTIGWHIQCMILDPIVNRAIDAAASMDGISKALFLIEAAKSEIIKRGFYEQVRQVVEKQEEEFLPSN